MRIQFSGTMKNDWHGARFVVTLRRDFVLLLSVVAMVSVAAAQNPGRILTSTGSAFGGIIEFNTNGSNLVMLTSNNFDNGCPSDNRFKNYHPSVSRDGKLIAFQSNRPDTSSYRIYVMNSDGTNVRQLTFDPPAGEFQANTVNDNSPVISPDGRRVAFISNRSVVTIGSPPAQYRPRDIYVINTDGSGLQKVTTFQPNSGNGVAGSDLASVVWSPNNTRLAFRGLRLATVNSVTGYHFVLGTINADGSGESMVAVLDTTGQSNSLDWSPNGRYIGVIFGDEAQGAPPGRVIIYDLQTNGRSDFLQGAAIQRSSNFRFSPDSQRFVVVRVTDFNFNTTVLTFLNVDGTGQTDVTVQGFNPADPIWWQNGAAIPTPARLDLIPDQIVVRNGGPKVQMLPTLYDAQNNVIVRAATGWTLGCGGGTPTISNSGLISAPTTTSTYTDQVCAGNVFTTCAKMFVNPATNKSDEPEFFVRDHYGDFLSRAGDQSGVDFWTNQTTNCGASDLLVCRINVSASFFLSIESQQTGYLVERIYKAAFGDATGTSIFNGTHQLAVPIVRFNELLSDSQQIGQGVVVGQTGWEQQLENNKQAFTAAFVNRVRFASAFPTTMNPAQFVDKMFLNAGVTPSSADRNSAIGEFGSATDTSDLAARGRALRKVAENSILNQQEFNRAFVLMQYMGYLRRNPNDAPDSDYTGYDFWLDKLSKPGANYINAEMVKAFITALEYRARFGP